MTGAVPSVNPTNVIRLYFERQDEGMIAAVRVGWDGTIREGPYITACLILIATAFIVIAWKQENNGTSYVFRPLSCRGLGAVKMADDRYPKFDRARRPRPPTFSPVPAAGAVAAEKRSAGALDSNQGWCDLEKIDRGGSHTGVTVSIPDRGQTGHDDFDLLQATDQFL